MKTLARPRQVDADTLEMLRTINAGSLPGVKEVQVRAAAQAGQSGKTRVASELL